MALIAGSKLAAYEISGQLGAGGMGEVYRARDPRLDREVAIKVLPEAFSQDPGRLARFDREARALAALNHPGIAGIYGIEESDSGRFLVLELVEGPTLAARLVHRGPMPVEEALTVCRQIAEALEVAHEKGLIHRDLKPGNIKVTPDEKVKLLDFGLVKGMEGESHRRERESPTIAELPTVEGVILGTAAYMSPEQARGKPLDERADIWSFGCVLYELLTGRQAFGGATDSDTLAAVLEHEPDWEALPEATPGQIRSLLRRCLQKDASHRLHDIADARIEIEEAIESGSAEAGSPAGVAAPVSAHRKVRRRIAWSLVTLFVAATASLGVGYYREMTAEVQTFRTFVPAPEGARFGWGGRARPGSAEISPDGRHLVMVAFKDGQTMLWIRSLDELEARPLAGTEGAYLPFWSPDSRHVGFFTDPGNKLKKVPVAGGPAPALCDSGQSSYGAAWSQEGVIVFSPGNSAPLLKVPAVGGESIQVTELDEARGELTHRHPYFLPDGRHFLYVAGSSFYSPDIQLHAGSIDSNETKPILYDTSSNASYASGHLLFTRERTLMAQRFDVDRLELIGEAFPIAEDVALLNLTHRAAFSVSRNGILAYQTHDAQTVSNLVWYERSGVRGEAVGEPADYRDVSLSPDGTTAAVSIRDRKNASNWDLWMLDLVRGIRTRFTFEESLEGAAIWSPDGARVLFDSNRTGNWGIFQKPADGTGEAELVQEIEKVDLYCSDSFPDGQHLVCPGWPDDGKTGVDIYQLPLSEDAEFTPLIQTRFLEDHAAVSPDGRWLAYSSNELGGGFEVYVQPLPLRGFKWQVSTSGGKWSRWGPNGKELFYLDHGNTLMVAQIELGEESLKVGQIDSLSQIKTASLAVAAGYMYDVTPDGQRFLVIEDTEQPETSPVTLVINWTAELAK